MLLHLMCLLGQMQYSLSYLTSSPLSFLAFLASLTFDVLSPSFSPFSSPTYSLIGRIIITSVKFLMMECVAAVLLDAFLLLEEAASLDPRVPFTLCGEMAYVSLLLSPADECLQPFGNVACQFNGWGTPFPQIFFCFPRQFPFITFLFLISFFLLSLFNFKPVCYLTPRSSGSFYRFWICPEPGCNPPAQNSCGSFPFVWLFSSAIVTSLRSDCTPLPFQQLPAFKKLAFPSWLPPPAFQKFPVLNKFDFPCRLPLYSASFLRCCSGIPAVSLACLCSLLLY